MNKHKKKPMKPRYILWLIIILCLVFIGVSLNNNGEKLSIQKGISAFLLPMEKGLNSMGQWVGEQKEHSRSVNDLLEENENLEQEIDQLNAKISSMENNLSELESLRELLKMKEVYPDYEMVGARIISKEAGNWYHSFIIDKGSIRFFDTLQAVETKAFCISGLQKDVEAATRNLNIIGQDAVGGLVTSYIFDNPPEQTASLEIQPLSLQDFFIQMVGHKGGVKR